MADFNQINAEMIATMAARSNGAPGAILGLAIFRDVNIQVLSMQTCGIGQNPMVRFGGTGNPNGLLSKFTKALGFNSQDLIADFQKCAGRASENYAGPIRSGLPAGGGGDGPAIG
ncbi:MAG: hypothetical protein ACK529_00735 [Alphaproteobacteria bacterium]|jgi:hypothetical protein